MKEKFLSAMKFRHACKEFDTNKKISQEDFQYILEAGRLSPSSFGFEPWKFLVVQDESKREKLREFTWGAQKQLPTSSHFVVALAKKPYFMRYDSEYVHNFMGDIQRLPEEIVELKKGFFKKFQEEDFKLLESERTLTDWASKQTYIPMGNMMTGAALIGIDSCPIEGFDREKINEILVSDFGIDGEKYEVSNMMAFGYRINEPFEKTRQKMEDVVEWH